MPIKLHAHLLFLALILPSCSLLRFEPTHPAGGYRTKNLGKQLERFWDPTAPENIGIHETAWGRKRSIDLAYREYVRTLTVGKAGVNLSEDLLVRTLAGATSFGTGTFAAKEIQAFGIATALGTGLKSDFDKEVFFEQTIQVLVKRMDLLRAEALKEVNSLLTTGTSDQQILDAVDAYFAAGTLHKALIYLNSENPGGSSQEDTETKRAVLGLPED